MFLSSSCLHLSVVRTRFGWSRRKADGFWWWWWSRLMAKAFRTVFTNSGGMYGVVVEWLDERIRSCRDKQGWKGRRLEVVVREVDGMDG